MFNLKTAVGWIHDIPEESLVFPVLKEIKETSIKCFFFLSVLMSSAAIKS